MKKDNTFKNIRILFYFKIIIEALIVILLFSAYAAFDNFAKFVQQQNQIQNQINQKENKWKINFYW